MLTIIEEPVGDENELRGNAERITMQMARGSSAGGGFRSSSTIALSRSGTPQLQRARLSGVQKQTEPLEKVNLNVMGVHFTKAPLPGILQPGILQNVREAISATDFPVDQVPSTPSLSTSKNWTPNGVNREADKTALTKLVRRKRERRHKQKVQFRVTFPASMQPEEEAPFSLPAAVPFPVPVCMPSYILKSKKDCQLRKARLGGMGGDAVVSSLAEESGSEKEFIDLKANKHLAVKTSEHKAFERLHSTETVDALIMSEDLSEIRGKVTFAVSQVRPTVLKHILLRNKLVDGHIQLNMLPKQNLVGLVMSSSQATRELLRGLMFQQKGGGNKCLDGIGVESLSQYKSISECEPTPRPVSDTFNQSVAAGPGLFHRNRFPPGNTTLERLTWWERQADNICKDYEEMMSLRMKAKNKRDLDNGSIVHGLTNPGVKTQGDQRFERGSTSNTTMSQAESRQRKVEAMQLASEAEAELSQAINAAKNAKVRFEGLSRSTPPTRDHISREGARSAAGIPSTSFSTTGQRIDAVIRAVGSRSSWPRTRADKRCSSQLSERGKDDEFADFVDEGESYSRPATETGVRNRSASADLAAMNLSVGRSPLRHRARAEDRERGLLSTSKFLGSGAFLPEYVVKNNFAGGRRGFCIKAGLPYEVNTCDHVKELLVERKAEHVEDESELPENLLALKNLGTKRWRQGYERGITEFVPGMAKMQNPLKQIHPRDSKIFDEWCFGEEQLGPPQPIVSLADTNLEKSEDRKKGLLKPMSPKYTLHILGESQYKDTNCYSFGSVLHPKNDLMGPKRLIRC